MKSLRIVLLCASALLAQEPVSRVVQLKHVHPDSTGAVLNVMSANKVRYQVDGNLRIVVMHGPPEMVGAMEEALKKLDAPAPPPKNVELTFHLLLAGPEGSAQGVLPDLTGVVQQLQKTFALKAFRVLETAVVRAREGQSLNTSGQMAAPATRDLNATYGLEARHVSINGSNVRLDRLRMSLRLPSGAANNFYDAGLLTDIDIREGQKVVVGKSGVDGAAQSIFLVVTAKIVD
ncbi:MAG: hypothetical protein JNM66_27740 [Bryobacterales bacterium]|nr:hypothetical protein [Bryobacterales bacterium]